MINLELVNVSMKLAARTGGPDDTPAGYVMLFTDPSSGITVSVGYGPDEFRQLVTQLRGLDLENIPVGGRVEPIRPTLAIPHSRK